MSINSSNQLWYKGHYLSCSFSVINPLCLTHATECHWNPVHPPGRQPALLREVLPATAAWYLGYTHKFLWEVEVRQKRGCVRVCVCYLQALADPLRLPGSAEDHSASVLKSGQLSNNRLPYIQAGPFQLKWATKNKIQLPAGIWVERCRWCGLWHYE